MSSTTNKWTKPIVDPIISFYALFPLTVWPPISPANSSHKLTNPTLWILPPRNTELEGPLLSSDVECLKWQAFLALRGLTGIQVRWDISPDGGIDGRLPNLHAPRAGADDGAGELMAAYMIPGWVDKTFGDASVLEGYRDQAAKDESHAWVSLLEGKVHAALVNWLQSVAYHRVNLLSLDFRFYPNLSLRFSRLC